MTITALTDEAFRTLIATAVDGIIVIDIEGRILVYNGACERLFGYSLEEVAGRNVKTLMPSPHREKHDGYLSRHRLTGHRGIIGIGREVVGLRKDGTTFPLYLSVGEGSSDGNTIYVGIIHDLTERKRWEAALIEREASLKSMIDAGLGTSPTSMDEQKQADRNLRLIAEMGGLLATTLEFDDTLTNIAELVVANLADLCVINFVDEDGVARRARVFCREPANTWVGESLMRMPPGREQARIAQSVLELRKPALIADVTPDLVRSWAVNDEQLVALQSINPKSAMIVPLLAHGRLLGALSLISSESYGPGDLRIAMAIAERSAFYLDNARLYRYAKRTERRLRLIAEVGESLATSLEFDETLTNIALLVVANLADLCIIKFIDDDGVVRRARVFCRDPAKAWVGDALMRMPPGSEQFSIARSVLETRRSALITQVTPDIIQSWAANEEQLKALQSIVPKSAMIAPLLVHGRLLGAISMISSDASHPYGAEDLRVAEAMLDDPLSISTTHASIARPSGRRKRATTCCGSSPTTCAIP